MDLKQSLQPPRGMRDFYPEDMALRSAVFAAWRTASLRHGFAEYDACVVESLDLLKRKSGEEIVEQIYAFQDKSGRDLALRAEMTPTLARMVAARQGALSFPLKWFTIVQCFRYERTTLGRKREHYQWNLDILGEPSVAAEAEILATAAGSLLAMGLTSRDVMIHVSSRGLLSDLFRKMEIPAELNRVIFLALDKRSKTGDEETSALLRKEGVDERFIGPVFDLAGIASPDDALAVLGEPTAAYSDLVTLFRMLACHGIADMVRFDISVVRGLGYYTGVVFEAFDAERKFRAIFGGGRYDDLLGDIGGKAITGVGLGFGDVVISELLAAKGNPHARLAASGTILVGFMEEDQRASALAVATALRAEDRSVDVDLRCVKPKSFFSKAGNGNYGYAILIGPDDVQKGTFRMKKLADRSETEMPMPAGLRPVP